MRADASGLHRPKAGQGMNTSMMDTYNLTWKLAAVIKNQSPRSILPTYTAERRRVAIDLINFDHKFSRLFSGRPAKDAADEAGISMDEFKAAFEKGNEFASGTAMNYCASLITGKAGDEDDRGDGMRCDPPGAVSKETLTDENAGQGRIVVGKRFNTAKVMCQSDGRVKHFVDWLPSDGRWRVIVFSGDIRDEKQKLAVEDLASKLGEMQKRFTPPAQDIDSVIDILTVSATPRAEVELADYHPVLRPMTTRYHQPNSGGSGKKALSQDYSKVFTDELETWHDGPCNAYKTYGVPASGAVVVLRPDSYVALLVGLADAELVTRFFEKCLLPGTQHVVASAAAANPSMVDGLNTKSSANLHEATAEVAAAL
jgi:phenol 2-monooxygenase (NADPH)